MNSEIRASVRYRLGGVSTETKIGRDPNGTWSPKRDGAASESAAANPSMNATMRECDEAGVSQRVYGAIIELKIHNTGDITRPWIDRLRIN